MPEPSKAPHMTEEETTMLRRLRLRGYAVVVINPCEMVHSSAARVERDMYVAASQRIAKDHPDYKEPQSEQPSIPDGV